MAILVTETLEVLTEVQEYIIRTNEAIESCYAMELCTRVQSIKDNLTGGALIEYEGTPLSSRDCN